MNQDHGVVDIRGIVEPLYRGKFWMQLLGVVSILYGVLSAITVVGLIVAWIPIWAGVVLMQAAGAASRAPCLANKWANTMPMPAEAPVIDAV